MKPVPRTPILRTPGDRLRWLRDRHWLRTLPLQARLAWRRDTKREFLPLRPIRKVGDLAQRILNQEKEQ